MWKCCKNFVDIAFFSSFFKQKNENKFFFTENCTPLMWERDGCRYRSIFYKNLHKNTPLYHSHNSSVVILPTPLIISLKPNNCIWLGADTPNQFVPWHKWNIIAATISLGKNSISNMHYRKSIYHQKHKK